MKSIVDSNLHPKIEIIIVDGKSLDSTLDVANKYKSYISTIISEKDSGIYDAWNKGIKASNGKWITFIGSGDVFTNNSLAVYLNVINNIDVHFNFISSAAMLTKNSRPIRQIGHKWDWNKFKKYMCISHVGSLHLSDLFNQYGNFNSKYKICGDYEFLLRVGLNLKAKYINIVTVLMESGGKSDSFESLNEVYQIKKNLKINNILILKFYQIYSFSKLTIRKVLWY